MVALRAVSHRLEGRRAGAKLELAIVIDLNALIGIWGVRGCASEFRTSTFFCKNWNTIFDLG